MFLFPPSEKISQWMPRRVKKHFPNARVIKDCYKIGCQRPSGLLNSSVFSNYKSKNTWKTCTPSGLVRFALRAWDGRI